MNSPSDPTESAFSEPTASPSFDPAVSENPSPNPDPTPTAWSFVEEYPALTVVGFFLVGLALGCSLPHHEESRRERLLHEPLDEVKGLLHHLIASIQKGTAHALDTADAKTTGLIDSVKSAFKRCH